MKAFKISVKRILLGLAGLKVCVEKVSGRELLCSHRETNLGQLIQK